MFCLIDAHFLCSLFLNFSHLGLVFFVHLMMGYHPVLIELVFLVFSLTNVIMTILTSLIHVLRFGKWWRLILWLHIWMFNHLTLNLTSVFSRFPIIIFLMSILNLTCIFLILRLMIFIEVFTGCAISFFLVVESSLFSCVFVITGLSISVTIYNSFVHFHLFIVIITSFISWAFLTFVIKLIVSFLKFPLLLIWSISLLDFHSSIFLIIIINRLL